MDTLRSIFKPELTLDTGFNFSKSYNWNSLGIYFFVHTFMTKEVEALGYADLFLLFYKFKENSTKILEGLME